MTDIIDRRHSNKNRSSDNRKRFIDRCKDSIKDQVDSWGSNESIKDFGTESKRRRVKLKKKTLDEPTFQNDPQSGQKHIVVPGNDRFERGKRIPKSGKSAGQGGSGPGDVGDDEFIFTLTREEFMDIYFSDMALPDFIKQSMGQNTKYKLKKAGFSKEGIPQRLNVKKTFEQAIGRRIATRSQGKKPLYLDDEDIRYDYFTKVPKPITKAVMFCVMDVSGSMTQELKDLSKRFFLLLYLFLDKEYEQVELRFIRHHHEAKEVDEKEFFYSTETGGTVVSEAFKLVNQIIKKDYPLTDYNIYVAQASDGDNWDSDNSGLVDFIENEILPKVQYMAYVEVLDAQRYEHVTFFGLVPQALSQIYEDLVSRYDKFNARIINGRKDIYPVLRDLFAKVEHE